MAASKDNNEEPEALFRRLVREEAKLAIGEWAEEERSTRTSPPASDTGAPAKGAPANDASAEKPSLFGKLFGGTFSLFG